MHTTQTDQPVCPVSAISPTLHLLYSGSVGVVGWVRALRISVTPIGRDITDEEGIALPDDPKKLALSISLTPATRT